MSGADHVAWYVLGLIISAMFGAALHWLFRKDNCKECGIAELKAEISRLCSLIETLWEKAGLTVKDRLEIEKLEKG